MDRHEVVHPRMGLFGVRAATHLGHFLLPLVDASLDGLFKGVIKAHGVGQRFRPAVHVMEIMHGHAGADDDDALVAESGDGAAEAVVGVRVLGTEERGLDDGHAEGVLVRVESDVEAGPDAVVEAALGGVAGDVVGGDKSADTGGEGGGANVRVGCGVVVEGEAGEVVD